MFIVIQSDFFARNYLKNVVVLLLSLCSHTFCKECINQWKQTKTTCPECVQKISQELITEDRLAAKIIDDLEVSCIHKLCDWKDRLELLEKHVNVCAFKKDVPKWAKELKSEAHVKLDQNKEEMIYGTAVNCLKKTIINVALLL